jgi:hypothetical protein
VTGVDFMTALHVILWYDRHFLHFFFTYINIGPCSHSSHFHLHGPIYSRHRHKFRRFRQCIGNRVSDLVSSEGPLFAQRDTSFPYHLRLPASHMPSFPYILTSDPTSGIRLPHLSVHFYLTPYTYNYAQLQSHSA